MSGNMFCRTPIQKLHGRIESNNIFVMRDDLIPYSFGGNKVRKAMLYFDEIRNNGFDTVVTYGSKHSNHCRIVANMAAEAGYPCVVISPAEDKVHSFNQDITRILGAGVECCPVNEVKQTISRIMNQFIENGNRPYFIPGGGHGLLGTKAYVRAYDDIMEYSKTNKVGFDYIIHASGTGTTQAGLICGQNQIGSMTKIVGISIARNTAEGSKIILDSVNEYRRSMGQMDLAADSVIFTDRFRLSGYGSFNSDILKTIKSVLIYEGIPMDTVYTGKAFWGMKEFLRDEEISEKNILFIHTGGTPIFFDNLEALQHER